MMQTGGSVFGEGEKISLELLVKEELALQLSETPLSASQVVSKLNNTYRITADVVDSKQLEQWISGLGELVKSHRKIVI